MHIDKLVSRGGDAVRKLLMLLPVAIALAAEPASATQILLTFTGTVTSGSQTNVFTAGSSNLAGKAVTLAFTSVLPTPGATVINFPGHDEVYGTGLANPVISATITVDGAAFTWGSTPADGYDYSFGQLVREDEVGSPALDWIYGYLVDFGDNPFSYSEGVGDVFTTVNEIMDDPDFFLPVDYLTSPGQDAGVGGHFRTQAFDSSSGTFSSSADLNLSFSRVTAAVVPSGVPEPATWAMMLVGFGAVGWSMRRKQRETVSYSFS